MTPLHTQWGIKYPCFVTSNKQPRQNTFLHKTEGAVAQWSQLNHYSQVKTADIMLTFAKIFLSAFLKFDSYFT